MGDCHATNNKQHATNNTQHTTHNAQRTTQYTDNTNSTDSTGNTREPRHTLCRAHGGCGVATHQATRRVDDDSATVRVVTTVDEAPSAALLAQSQRLVRDQLTPTTNTGNISNNITAVTQQHCIGNIIVNNNNQGGNGPRKRIPRWQRSSHAVQRR